MAVRMGSISSRRSSRAFMRYRVVRAYHETRPRGSGAEETWGRSGGIPCCIVLIRGEDIPKILGISR